MHAQTNVFPEKGSPKTVTNF